MKKFCYRILIGVVVALSVFACSKNEKANSELFVRIAPDESGIDFVNQLYEDDSINILVNEFVYNGAGVALGDVNGDGLDDVFMAGNQVENQLYLNQGGLTFKKMTEASGINKPDSLMWSSGVSIVDINLDGKNDIYICNTFRKKAGLRRNLLYINQGNDENGSPYFKEMANTYGVADTTYSSHAQFFDYDNDGDVDLFIGVNQIDGINPTQFRPKEDDGSSPTRDRLYENLGSEGNGHPIFVDVSDEAGIRFHGYSHSSLIHDFNQDGYLDIFVSNDFLSNDILYLNNQDKTFTNKISESFKHLSLSSMGSDVADVNNDGKMDLYVTEMQPYYNKRKKLFQGPSNYQKEIFTKKYEYEQQYARNVLHLNNGATLGSELPVFNDVGMMAGLQETDWSWAPLFGDFDNDGLQDLFITNGFPKDVTDRDFGDFRLTANRLVTTQQLLEQIPEIKIPNFIFKNKGNLQFEDYTEEWGLNFGTYSNGAAYGDLDNDGDLDLVINNINDPALIMENKANELFDDRHWLSLKLKGPEQNPLGIGTSVSLYTGSIVQKRTIISGRGYLSQPENKVHFGLGPNSVIDSITIVWPNNKVQRIKPKAIDTVLAIDYNPNNTLKSNRENDSPLLIEVAETYNLEHFSRDIDFIDFNFQSTIPHKFSQYGPSLAVGDVNGDGLEDMFVSASRGFKQKWFIQQDDGTFTQDEVAYKNNPNLEEEDSASLLFDADNDGDLDLYLARGCAQYPENHVYYTDRLLLNDGNGNFTISENSLPEMKINSSVVRASDYDHDGDLDLFVGSRVLPFSYPMAERSVLLRNESTQQEVKFIDATSEVSEDLLKPGLVSDALWTDFNNDNWPDMILACEWQPLQIFKNNNGKLSKVRNTGIEDLKGWWNSLSAADLDNDGDIDYIAGNSGTNIYTKGNSKEPVKLYAKDLDNNGSIDPLISYYLRDSLGVKKEYLYHPWQDVTKQFVGIRKKFNSFGEFGELTVPEMFSDGLLDDAQVYEMNYMNTSWIENLGNGKFKVHELPIQAQVAPIFGSIAEDLNYDGALDIMLVGNDFGMEVQQGPADALNGLVLMNINGAFNPLSLRESNFYVPGNAKALVSLKAKNNDQLFVASQNNDSIRVFKKPSLDAIKLMEVANEENKALIHFKNGLKRVKEFYWGSTFMAQSGRHLRITGDWEKVEFIDGLGEKTREIRNE